MDAFTTASYKQLARGGANLIGSSPTVDELFLTIARQVAGRNVQPRRPGFIASAEFLPETAPWLNIVSVKGRGKRLYLRYCKA